MKYTAKLRISEYYRKFTNGTEEAEVIFASQKLKFLLYSLELPPAANQALVSLVISEKPLNP
jgi:hypothetical protein